MDTLTAGYQFSADAFRRFIIRTLTDDIRKRQRSTVLTLIYW
ncbi:TPA: hypothetical protein ACWR7B_004610 [Escherichia coli]|nr:hypothetical protein [Escherichia coli]